MKLITIATALLLTAGSIQAADTECVDYSNFARKTMGARQHGGLLSDEIKRANGNKELESLVVTAFNERRCNGKKCVNESIIDFQNKTYMKYLQCKSR